MSANRLIINPKDYKLKCSEEVLKTLKPYFEIKASSFSHFVNAPHLQNENSEEKSVQPKQEAKTSIFLTMRDANSGELLGKGNLVYDHTQEKPEKFEETVALKDVLGNEIGHAVVEVQQIKPQEPKRNSIEDEFRRMRKEMNSMMRATNRLFNSFSSRNFGRDWGFGLLDDFNPLMPLGGDDYEDECNECGHRGHKKAAVENEKKSPKSGNSPKNGPQSVQEPSRKVENNAQNVNAPEVEIKDEKL